MYALITNAYQQNISSSKYAFMVHRSHEMIYRPTVRCLHRRLMTRWYWCFFKFFQLIKIETFELSYKYCTAFTHKRTDSLGLPSLYIFTSFPINKDKIYTRMKSL